MGTGTTNTVDNVIQDHEILASKDSESDGNGSVGELTKFNEGEKALEKKLLRKIDLLIMPLIVVIYLMNFIDRYGFINELLGSLSSNVQIETITLLRGYKGWRMTCISHPSDIKLVRLFDLLFECVSC